MTIYFVSSLVLTIKEATLDSANVKKKETMYEQFFISV